MLIYLNLHILILQLTFISVKFQQNLLTGFVEGRLPTPPVTTILISLETVYQSISPLVLL